MAKYQQSEYSKLLKDPRWQKKRLEILQRDEFACQNCFDTETTLHVHHRYYKKGNLPWDYPEKSLVTLCEICHEYETTHAYEAKQLLLQALAAQGAMTSEFLDLGTAISSAADLPMGSEMFFSALSNYIKKITSDEAAAKVFRDEFFDDLKKRREGGASG